LCLPIRIPDWGHRSGLRTCHRILVLWTYYSVILKHFRTKSGQLGPIHRIRRTLVTMLSAYFRHRARASTINKKILKKTLVTLFMHTNNFTQTNSTPIHPSAAHGTRSTHRPTAHRHAPVHGSEAVQVCAPCVRCARKAGGRCSLIEAVIGGSVAARIDSDCIVPYLTLAKSTRLPILLCKFFNLAGAPKRTVGYLRRHTAPH
jgi:hypothetical protein